MSYTPGPWRECHNSWEDSTVYSDAGPVALCKIDSEATDETQAHFEAIKEANARLIAAAPDLLEALQLVLEQFTRTPSSLKDSEARGKAHAAIAKATGGAS